MSLGVTKHGILKLLNAIKHEWNHITSQGRAREKGRNARKQKPKVSFICTSTVNVISHLRGGGGGRGGGQRSSFLACSWAILLCKAYDRWRGFLQQKTGQLQSHKAQQKTTTIFYKVKPKLPRSSLFNDIDMH